MSKPLHNFELTSWTLTRSVISTNQHCGRRVPVQLASEPAADAGANAGGPQLEQSLPPDTTQLRKLCSSVCSFEAQKERTNFPSDSGVAAKMGKKAAAAVAVVHEAPVESLERKSMVSMGEEEQEVKKNGKEKKNTIPEKGKEQEPKSKGKKVVKKPKTPKGKEKQESNGKQKNVVESRAMENDSTQKSMNLRSQDPTEKKNTKEKRGSTSGPNVDWTFEKFPVSLSRKEIEEDFLFMTGRMPPRRPKMRAKKVQESINKLYEGPGSLPDSMSEDTYKIIEEPAPMEFW